ncbi:hypothetical protein [Chryseobacterium sp.]|uniref:hypothetical protein n=1 Tax=Chryseobacterium sp. TaxID=1871047 RepID=UPI003219C5E3
MEEKDFLEAGFLKSDDPIFKYVYSLATENEEDYEHESDKPELGYDIGEGRFAIWTGYDVFIYTNHTNPTEAIEWAKQIAYFEQ